MQLPHYAIEAKGLYKTFPATKTTPAKLALDGIDLAIPRGSIFGLLGPNGAGKSTFINILAGLTLKSEGKVSIWGRDIDERPRDARAVGAQQAEDRTPGHGQVDAVQRPFFRRVLGRGEHLHQALGLDGVVGQVHEPRVLIGIGGHMGPGAC